MTRRSDILLIVLATILLYFLLNNFTRNKTDLVAIDIDSIRVKGTLAAVTDFNSTNYFIYRGEPMGFHYELLKSFSDYLGVDLVIITENDREKAFELLRTGKADILALGISSGNNTKLKVKLSDPLYERGSVLVQPGNGFPGRVLPGDTTGLSSGGDHEESAGIVVYVHEGDSGPELLSQLKKVIRKDIIIREVGHDPEKLIQMVAEGEIRYAVCDENTARVNSPAYPGVDITTLVTAKTGITWGIRRRNSEGLAEELNKWINNFRKSGTYAILYAKYFKNPRTNAIVNGEYYALNTGRVSRYDEIIRTFSDSINWDWRLLASLICQESRFVADVRSWAGAYGLMQVMPETGKNFGVDITSSPSSNLKAGTLYLEWLHRIFDPKIRDTTERYKFILAAYNAGPGHILDAMKLAEKNGQDPEKWDGNVADWLLRKSDPLYYTDTVVKFGYFRGKESVAFVDNILERYEHYKNIIPANFQSDQ